MPKIHRLSSFHEYRPPDPSSGRLIEVTNANTADLLSIANDLYNDRGYSRLVYSVTKSQLRTYCDEFFADFVENVPVESDASEGISSKTALTLEEQVRCLVYDAFRSPLFTAQEFKYLTGTDFLTGIGIYSLSSKFSFGDSKKELLGKVAQYNLQSQNLSLRLMVAIIQPNSSWQLALGQIRVHKYTRSNSGSVGFALFDPAVFISSIFTKKSLIDVQHEKFDIYIPLVGDMSYYK
ncbi:MULTISPECIES: hypothetical protein [Paenibacillus]|uniref:hypothetical protein n=1 Tax=Paenibacillus TaxID=44249 RepID=UPI00096FA0B1|nr:hypothetical protein [Paenibacillus odorifer]OME34969.1 hypothetical protein BSK58_25005 [Paenibacillus odorifer]